MTPSTRQAKEKAMKHLLAEVLVEDDIHEAFTVWQVKDPLKMTRLTDNDLRTPFKGKDGEEMTLSIASMRSITDCTLWFKRQKERNMESWLSLNEDVLDDFLTNIDDGNHDANNEENAHEDAEAVAAKEAENKAIAEKERADMVANAVAAAVAAQTATTATVAAKATKGRFSLVANRHKATDIEKFTNPNQWYTWDAQFVSTAKMHGTWKVLDSTYNAETDEDREELAELNMFLFHCLSHVLVLPEGKRLLNIHRPTTNAKAVYQGLVQRFKNGEAANIYADKLKREFEAFKYGPEWTKGPSAFLVRWYDMGTELNDYVPGMLDDTARFKQLKIAVAKHPVLKSAVTGYASTMSITNDTSLADNFEKLYNLLNDLAVGLEHDEAEERNNGQRTANNTNVQDIQDGGSRGNNGRGNGGHGNGGRGNNGRGAGGRGAYVDYPGDRLTFEQLLEAPHSYMSHDRFNSLTPRQHTQLNEARARIPRPQANQQPQQQQQSQLVQANTHQQSQVHVPTLSQAGLWQPATQGPTGALGTNMTLHELATHQVPGTFVRALISNTHQSNTHARNNNQTPAPATNTVPADLVPMQMGNGQIVYVSPSAGTM
jgi:hypothetical protein